MITHIAATHDKYHKKLLFIIKRLLLMKMHALSIINQCALLSDMSDIH